MDKNYLTKIFVCLWLISFSVLSYAQKIDNPDSLMRKARKLAKEEHHERAIQLSDSILNDYPHYTGAKLLKARTLAWGQQLPEADSLIRNILNANPKNQQALLLASDISYWRKSYDTATHYLQQIDDTEELAYQKSLRKLKILAAKDKSSRLQNLADSLIALYPKSEEIKRYQDMYSKMPNELGVRYTFDYFSKPYNRRWHLFKWEYGRETKWGKSIAKIVQGDLIQSGENIGENLAWQYQIDFYPELSKKLYGYLSYGYSASELFPTHRAGAELYRSLAEKWEISAGIRYMDFSALKNPIWIYTVSLSRYAGNWLFNLRPYFSPKNNAFSQSWNFFARYYYTDKDYIELLLGTGISPDITSNLSTGAPEEQLRKLQTQKIRVSWKHFWTKRMYSSLFGNLRVEELKNKNLRRHIQAGIAYHVLF